MRLSEQSIFFLKYSLCLASSVKQQEMDFRLMLLYRATQTLFERLFHKLQL